MANTKNQDRIDSKTIAMFDPNLRAVINLDGRDIKLKQVKFYLPDETNQPFGLTMPRLKLKTGKAIILLAVRSSEAGTATKYGKL